MQLTDKQIKYLKHNFGKLSSTEMGLKLGVPKQTIKSYYKRNGMSMSIENRRALQGAAQRKITTATKAEDKLIKKNYLNQTPAEMALVLKRSKTFVQTRIRQLGLVIPKELHDERVKRSRIQPGNVPANKGKKMTEYMSAEQIEKIRKTSFQKGQMPHNTKPVGYERVSKDGYIEVKTEKKTGFTYFVLKHRLIYAEHNEVVLKPSDLIVFKDGNKRNFEPSNLELVTYEENLRRNSINNYPEPVRDVIRLKAKLNRKINNLKTSSNGTEQN